MRSHVLVCDDDTVNLEVIREILQDEYEVETVISGEACLAKLSEFQPDVLLLDIMMPGLNGYETYRQLAAASNGNVPQVILVSARASTEDRLAGYEAGADDFISKPFDLAEYGVRSTNGSISNSSAPTTSMSVT